jgi:PKD repeat protein
MHARHAYAVGTYLVRISVSNSAGLFGFASFNVTVSDIGRTLVFSQNPLVTDEGVLTTITATSNDPTVTAPLYVHTDFGDGTSQDQLVQTSGPIVVSHTYAASAPTIPGGGYTAYTAVVTARDHNNVLRSGSLEVRVTNLPPVITAARDVYFPEAATSLTLASFTDASAGPWRVIIDGIPGYGNDNPFPQPSSISIPYTASLGDRTVTVTVVDRGGAASSASVRIHVVNAAPVVGTIAVPSPLLEGGSFTVSADFSDPGYGIGSGSETYTCTVDFGDGSGPAAGVVTGRTCASRPWNYDTVGVYTITVAVRDSRGGVGTASTTVNVANVAPVLDPITADGSGYEGPVTVSTTFWDPGLDGSEEYACSIDYGDGTGLEVGTMDWAGCTGAAHFYAHPGTYTVTMTVTDSHGAAGVGTVEVESGNASPEVWTGTLTGPVAEGGLATITAEFTDPGSELGANSESYSCTAAFGDGATPVAGVVTGTTCTVQTTLLDPDPYWVTVTVTDSNGAQGSIAFWIEVSNVAPVVAAVSTGPAIEGQAIVATASFTDPGYGSAETYSCTVDYGDGSGPQVGVVSGNACQGPPHTYRLTGTYVVTITVSDSNGGTSSASKSVSVSNVAPAIVKVTATPALTKTGSTVTASASFTDPGTSEKYTATWDWGDGSTTVVNLGSAARSVGGSHVYSKAGFYKVKVTVSDGQASDSMEASQVVVYDPARTLSGSGSLTSPAGSCRLSKGCSAAGTAGFSLSVSYAKAATKPTLSLAFSVSGFSFDATAADWMVAGGGTATVQGAGKVNGASGYTFRLAAIDGKADAMRLQVWSPSGVLVYDNGSVAPLKAGSITVK